METGRKRAAESEDWTVPHKKQRTNAVVLSRKTHESLDLHVLAQNASVSLNANQTNFDALIPFLQDVQVLQVLVPHLSFKKATNPKKRSRPDSLENTASRSVLDSSSGPESKKAVLTPSSGSSVSTPKTTPKTKSLSFSDSPSAITSGSTVSNPKTTSESTPNVSELHQFFNDNVVHLKCFTTPIESLDHFKQLINNEKVEPNLRLHQVLHTHLLPIVQEYFKRLDDAVRILQKTSELSFLSHSLLLNIEISQTNHVLHLSPTLENLVKCLNKFVDTPDKDVWNLLRWNRFDKPNNLKNLVDLFETDITMDVVKTSIPLVKNIYLPKFDNFSLMATLTPKILNMVACQQIPSLTAFCKKLNVWTFKLYNVFVFLFYIYHQTNSPFWLYEINAIKQKPPQTMSLYYTFFSFSSTLLPEIVKTFEKRFASSVQQQQPSSPPVFCIEEYMTNFLYLTSNLSVDYSVVKQTLTANQHCLVLFKIHFADDNQEILGLCDILHEHEPIRKYLQACFNAEKCTVVAKNIATTNFEDFIINHPDNITRDFMSEMVYFTQCQSLPFETLASAFEIIFRNYGEWSQDFEDLPDELSKFYTFWFSTFPTYYLSVLSFLNVFSKPMESQDGVRRALIHAHNQVKTNPLAQVTFIRQLHMDVSKFRDILIAAEQSFLKLDHTDARVKTLAIIKNKFEHLDTFD